MLIKVISGATNFLNKPKNWDGKLNGHCVVLPIRKETINNMQFLVSAWEPTPDELDLLNRGAAIQLYIGGNSHPVVALSVGEAPE
jgi:hypothetical protein